MTALTHHRCIKNFLLGFSSILSIIPVTSTTPFRPINAEEAATKLIRSSWENVGKHLNQTRTIGNAY
ncbi:hypothetical protein [Actinobacillus porcinus]|uniref:hypothetical protein n=2 Tax=Actinobacillus TaxID=713 RepID=UPI0023549351|nr:hypothetical protein [Actinobacillus porcinus]